ncbi:MAG: hypothetical protein O7B99_10495 [Planctomycetota bacterium]|nr:hypothetical protein [Planctomycetota bacterium]
MNRKPRSRATLSLTVMTSALAAALLLPSASGLPKGSDGLYWDILVQAEALSKSALLGIPLKGDPCDTTANVVARGSIRGLQFDLAVAAGNCLNLTDGEEVEECMKAAWEEFDEGVEEVLEQLEARRDLCEKLGGGPYAPEIDPEDFVQGIDNPFLPYVVGYSWTYQKATEDGELEEVVVTVTDMTKEILGVECTVVQDIETVDGVVAEDTFDYYAQDKDGNVWYFGELSFGYDEEGELEGLDGSWKAGVDGAKPGIIMFANPVLDTTYRQEFALTEAEDAGTISGLDESVVVPFGAYDGCRKILDFTPLEPDAMEEKFFAQGVGLVLEVDLETGERVELVDFTSGN